MSEPAPGSKPMHPRWMVVPGNFLFKFRNALFPVVFVLMMLLTRPAHFLNNPALDRYVMAAGAAIALFGQALRLLVIGFAYIKRGGKDKKVYAHDLVVAGLYAHSRNPMYVGNFMIAAGLGIVYGSPWVYYFLIPFFAWVYLAITAAEETYLLGKFGSAFEDYMRDVNRFWPDFRGLRSSLAGYRYRWKEVLSKEYGTVFGTATGLIALATWKKYYCDGQAVDYARLAIYMAPLVVFYLVVRAFKVARKLRDPA